MLKWYLQTLSWRLSCGTHTFYFCFPRKSGKHTFFRLSEPSSGSCSPRSGRISRFRKMDIEPVFWGRPLCPAHKNVLPAKNPPLKQLPRDSPRTVPSPFRLSWYASALYNWENMSFPAQAPRYKLRYTGYALRYSPSRLRPPFSENSTGNFLRSCACIPWVWVSRAR